MGNDRQDNRDQPRIEWYLIDTERNFAKTWDFIINLVTIYNLVMTPFIMTFPDVYQIKVGDEYQSVTERQQTLRNIERFIDIIFMIEIVFNFVKRTRAHKDLKSIAINYLTTYFVFDIVATIPNLMFFNESFDYYYIKCIRVVHAWRLTRPLDLLLGVVLQKYSKKRQNDLTSFADLIFFVVYLSHINACVWLYLGKLDPCKVNPDLDYNLPNDDTSN